jgi:hypothetical protein
MLKALMMQDASTRVDELDILALTSGYEIVDNKINKEGEASNALGKAIIPFAIGITFFMFIALCGNRFLLTVVEEKELKAETSKKGTVEEPKDEAPSMTDQKEIIETSGEGYAEVLSERKLVDSDLDGKTKKDLEILRNSIYAKYGYKFKREDLLNYFSQFSWYNPITRDMSEVYNSMSDVEKYNIDFIKSAKFFNFFPNFILNTWICLFFRRSSIFIHPTCYICPINNSCRRTIAFNRRHLLSLLVIKLPKEICVGLLC